MDQSTPETVRRVLLAHGVPPALLDSVTAAGSPFRLLAWGTPNLGRARELESLVPALAGICPLAEEDGATVVGFLPASNRFVRYYYEDGRLGDAAIELLGTGYDQFAATILLQFEEAGLGDEFDEAARILAFRQVDELRRLLDTEPYDDEAVELFRTSLAGR
jgi:hypothetical protein